MLLDGNDSMFYFDSMRDMEDLRNTRWGRIWFASVWSCF
jgi:hypothetical protein